MYFQNHPTNFIDKFVLIINPLQMNVNFFLGHQCKILRLYLAAAVIVLIGSAVILCVDKPKEWSGNLRKTDDEPLPMRKKGLWRYGERSGLDIIFTFFFDET